MTAPWQRREINMSPESGEGDIGSWKKFTEARWGGKRRKVKIQTNNLKRRRRRRRGGKLFRFHIKKSAGNLCLFVPNFRFSLARLLSLLGDSVDIYDYSKDFHLSLKSFLLLCHEMGPGRRRETFLPSIRFQMRKKLSFVGSGNSAISTSPRSPGELDGKVPIQYPKRVLFLMNAS
jgi:hypothetical protein